MELLFNSCFILQKTVLNKYSLQLHKKSCHWFCCDVWSEACNAKPDDTSPFHFFKYGSGDLVTAESIHALWKEDHYDNLGQCCMGFEFFTAV